MGLPWHALKLQAPRPYNRHDWLETASEHFLAFVFEGVVGQHLCIPKMQTQTDSLNSGTAFEQPPQPYSGKPKLRTVVKNAGGGGTDQIH